GYRPHGLRDDCARGVRTRRARRRDRLLLRLRRLERGCFRGGRSALQDETKPHPVGLLAGEGRRSPFASAVLALCLFSLAGIPATAGFIGKFFVFKAAIEQGLYALAVIGVLNSLVSIGYYLKVVYVLYMRDPVEET